MAKGAKSPKGKLLGRPQSRFNELKTIPTRCPEHMYLYLKSLYPQRWASLTGMYDDMFKQFIAERPWEHGLVWRKPKATSVHVGAAENRTGWVQVNVQIDIDLSKEAQKVAAALTAEGMRVSMAMFAYTAIFWWVQFVYPPLRKTPK